MFEDTIQKDSFDGKLENAPNKFKAYFLLLFTKELIKNSTDDFFRLKHSIRKKEIKIEKPKPKKPEEVLPKKTKKDKEISKTKEENKDPYYLSLMHRMPRPDFERELFEPPRQIFATPKKPAPVKKPSVQPIHPRLQKPLPPPMPAPRKPLMPLRIPDQPLPYHLQYLQPYPTSVQIDLGKLEPLGQDPNVKTIECNGPDEQIIVKGTMGTKPTNFILNKEEIDELLQRFSEVAKIPLNEGVHKIVVGKYILSAIVSEIVGSKFIIRKMDPMSPMGPYGNPAMPGPMFPPPRLNMPY